MSDKDNTDYYVMYCCPGCHAQFSCKETLISHKELCVKKTSKSKDLKAKDDIDKKNKLKTDDSKTEVVENKGTNVFPVTLRKANNPCQIKMKSLITPTARIPPSTCQEDAKDDIDKKNKLKTDDSKTEEGTNVFPVSFRKANDPCQIKIKYIIKPTVRKRPSTCQENRTNGKNKLVRSVSPSDIFPVSVKNLNAHPEHSKEESFSSVDQESQEPEITQGDDESGLHLKISNVTSMSDPSANIDGFEMECDEIKEERCSDVEESDTEDYFHHASEQILTPQPCQLGKNTNIALVPQKLDIARKESKYDMNIPNVSKESIFPIQVDLKNNLKTSLAPKTVQQSLLSSTQSITSSLSIRTVNSVPKKVVVIPRKQLASSAKSLVPSKTPPGTLLLIPQGSKSNPQATCTSTDPTQQTSGNVASGITLSNSKQKGITGNILLIPLNSNQPSTTPSPLSRMNNNTTASSVLGQPFSAKNSAPSVTDSGSVSQWPSMFMPTTALMPRYSNTSAQFHTLNTETPMSSIPVFVNSPVVKAPVNPPISKATIVQNAGNGQVQSKLPLQTTTQIPNAVPSNAVASSNSPVQFFINASGQICILPMQNLSNPNLIQNPTSLLPANNVMPLLQSPCPVTAQNLQPAPVMGTNNLLNVSVDSSGKLCFVQTMNTSSNGNITPSVPNLSVNQRVLLTGLPPAVTQASGQNSSHTILPPMITTPIPVINAPDPVSLLCSTASVSTKNSTNTVLAQSFDTNVPTNQTVSMPIISLTNLNSQTKSPVQKLTVSTPVVNASAFSPAQSSPTSTGPKIQQETSNEKEPLNESKIVSTGLSLPLILWPGKTASSNTADLPTIINPHSDVLKLFEKRPETDKNMPPMQIVHKNSTTFKVKNNPLEVHNYSRVVVSSEQKDPQTKGQKANYKGKKSAKVKPKLVTVESSCQTDFADFPALLVTTKEDKENKTKGNVTKSTEARKQDDEFTLMMNHYTENQPEAVRRSSRIRLKPQKSYVDESDSEDEINYGEFVIEQDKQLNIGYRIVGTQTLHEKLVADVMKDLINIAEEIDSPDQDQDEEMDENDPDYVPDGIEKFDSIEENNDDYELESGSNYSDEDNSDEKYTKRYELMRKRNSSRLNPRDVDLEKHKEKYTQEVTTVGGVKREFFKCIFCDIGFKVLTEDALKRHLFKHVHRRFFCPFCSHNDMSGNFSKHIASEHSDQLTSVCDSCGKGFIDDRQLNIHKSKEHQEYILKCDHCDNGFTFYRELIKHLVDAHNSLGLFTCQECDKHFLHKKQFDLHCQYARCEKKQSHLCQECGAVMASKDMLVNHIKRVHKKERHYMCEMCPYTCFHMGQLKDHLSIHTLEYRHKCPYCDFRAAKQMQVASHMRIHTGDKPYKCDQCNYKSAWNIQLRTHRGAHFSRFMVMCDPCGIAFKDERGLQLHQKKKHSGKDSSKGGNPDNEVNAEEMEFSADNNDSDEHTETVEKEDLLKSKRKRPNSRKGGSSAKKPRKSKSTK